MPNLTLHSHTTASDNANIKTLDIVGNPIQQHTIKAGGAVRAGAGVRFDATTGKFIEGNAANATNANIVGIALRTRAEGEGVTVIQKGIIAGFDLSGLNFGATVYLSDTTGVLADAQGTVNKPVGRVVPVYGQLPGSTPMKALLVEL